MTAADVRVALAGDGVVAGERGVVAAQNPAVATVGIETLVGGGNVVDAAIAAVFAAAVADVGRTGIGGYGGHLIYREASGETWLVDFPSRAPLGAFDHLVEPDPVGVHGPARTGPLAVGVPAIVAGLGAAHARFGRLSWSELLAPAIRLADNGIQLRGAARNDVFAERDRIGGFAETARVFLDAWEGEHLRQPDLAATLRVLAREGPRSMYEGSLGEQIVGYVQSAGGVLERADLAGYRAAIQKPRASRYRQYELLTPGSGSGAGVLVPALGALADFELADLEPLGWERFDRLAATLGRVWTERLEGRDYGCTEHLAVADADGNIVACTTTLQMLMGCGVTVPGTGIVLNNAMTLFDPRRGRPNSVAPGKVVVTNMCPTVAVRDQAQTGPPLVALGASGGRSIPSMLIQALTLAIDHDWSVDRALAAPRIHHDGSGRLRVEEGVPLPTVDALKRRGYMLDVLPWASSELGGQLPAVWLDRAGRPVGAPDPRRHGAAAAL